VTPAPAFFFWQQQQIGINGSDQPVIYLYPREDYERLEWFSDEQLKVLTAFNSLNFSTSDYKTGTAIPYQGTASYTVPLLSPFYDRLDIETIEAPLYITFQMDPNPVVASSSGVLQLVSFNLRIIASGDPLNDAATRSLYQSIPAYLPFVSAIPYPFVQQLNAGVATDIQLTPVVGKVCMMTISILANGSNNTNNGNITFYSLSGTDATLTSGFIDILDNSKVTILGSGQLTEKYCRATGNLVNGGNGLSLVQPINFIVFCNNPSMQVKTGNINGYQNFDGTFFLRVIPGATFTSGSYTVLVNTYYYGAFVQIKGRIARGF
jgi:hypothetical protein